jgi:glucose/arabinose dehydrogenase
MRASYLLTLALLLLPLSSIAASNCPQAVPAGMRPLPGLCAEVIASGLKMPRGLAILPDGKLLLTEMQRWDAAQGRLLQLEHKADGWQQTVLARGWIARMVWYKGQTARFTWARWDASSVLIRQHHSKAKP